MAFVKTDDVHYKGIAAAIRGIHGKEDTYTPPEMAAFIAAGGVNIKPWNIPEGLTVMGVEGTMKLPVTQTFPSDLPVTEEEVDEEVRKDDADAPVEDKFVLIDDNGNITTGYMYGEEFEITYYDPVTTEFKAKGWRRVSYHTTGENAGTYTRDNFRYAESGGWNYLKNIRMCTREKLYYNGVEVWPNSQYGAQKMFYNGTLLPGLPEWDKEKYPYAIIHTDSPTNQYRLRISKVPLTLHDIDGNYTFSANSGIGYDGFECDGTEWVERGLGNPHIHASTYIWSNYDIIDNKGFAGEVGSVYRYGSDPVPAYSYNGTVLPELPEWDKEKYPYALMQYFGLNFILGEVGLLLTTKPMIYCPDELWKLHANDMGTFDELIYIGNVLLVDGSHNNRWSYQRTNTEVTDVGNSVHWSNYDILNEDGSIYYAASDPIPVY